MHVTIDRSCNTARQRLAGERQIENTCTMYLLASINSINVLSKAVENGNTNGKTTEEKVNLLILTITIDS